MGCLKDSPGVIGNAPRAYITTEEVMLLLGCKEDWAYRAIRDLNKQCEKKGNHAFPPGKANKFLFAKEFDIPILFVDRVINYTTKSSPKIPVGQDPKKLLGSA